MVLIPPKIPSDNHSASHRKTQDTKDGNPVRHPPQPAARKTKRHTY